MYYPYGKDDMVNRTILKEIIVSNEDFIIN